MITIGEKSLRLDDAATYTANELEKSMFNIMISSKEQYYYPSAERLKFELKLRTEIIHSAREQSRSGLEFAIFRKSKCNRQFWERTRDGGFRMKPGVRASDAIRDIFQNGNKYATECATALLIIYYKRILLFI